MIEGLLKARQLIKTHIEAAIKNREHTRVITYLESLDSTLKLEIEKRNREISLTQFGNGSWIAYRGSFGGFASDSLYGTGMSSSEAVSDLQTKEQAL